MDWKVMMAEQQDFLRPLIRQVLQQVMEAEMDASKDVLVFPAPKTAGVPTN
jgi:transposase-like protein